MISVLKASMEEIRYGFIVMERGEEMLYLVPHIAIYLKDFPNIVIRKY